MADIELQHGGRTLRRLGGKPVPGVWAVAPVLSGPAAMAGLQIEQIIDEWGAPRWMLTPAGTSGLAPPTSLSSLADGATLDGTITAGAVTKSIRVTIEADAYDFRPTWASTTAEAQTTLVNTVLPVRLGDKLRPQPGTYGRSGGESVYGGSVRFRTPQGEFNGSNHVVIEPREPGAVDWEFLIVDSALEKDTGRKAYLHFKGIRFPLPLLPEGRAEAHGFAVNVVVNYVKITHCQFEGEPTAGQSPYGMGRDLCSAIRSRGDFWEITDNSVGDVADFVANPVIGQGLTIARNRVRGVWNDGIKTSSYQLLIEDNYIFDKRCMDPNSSQQGVHPDLVQHLGYRDGNSYSGFIFRRNVIVRGRGRPGWPCGQGIYLDDSSNGSQMFGVVIEFNIIIHTMQNGIVCRNGNGPIIRNNLTIQDPTGSPVVDTNTGLNPKSYLSQIRLSGGSGSPQGTGGEITGNISCNVIEVSGYTPAPTQSGNITLSPTAANGPTSYADNFANPQFGAVLDDDLEAVLACFKPKPGSAVDLAGAGPLDASGQFRTFGAAEAVTLSGPASGAAGVASSDFTVAANGALSGAVVVTPNDGGAGGTFAPTSVTISPSNPTRRFAYVPPAGAATRTIRVTNNGGLSNPPPLSYQVNKPPIAAVALVAPRVLALGAAGVVMAELDGVAPSDVEVTLAPVAGLTFGGSILIEAGSSSGETSVLATAIGTKVLTATNDADLAGPAAIDLVVIKPPRPPAVVGGMVRFGFIVGRA